MIRLALACLCSGLLLQPFASFGQVPPDAGRALEESRPGGQPPAPRPPPPLDLREPPRPALSAPATMKVFVKQFRITGTTVFAEEALAAQIASFTNRELTLADLEEAAARISRYYRERGYFVARAYLPAQDIRDGVVEITVLEGRVGSLRIERAPGTRLSESVIRDTVTSRQPEGSVIEQRRLERGLLLLNDLPGIGVQSTFSPGGQPGTSDARLAVSEGPLLSSAVDVDTFGNRFTGRARLGATVYLNDPSGRGDLATLRAAHSEGLDNLRLGYSLPVGSDGLRLSANAAAVRYRLCCEFSALDARGTATELSLSALYPLVRSRDYNVYASATGTGKDLFNETVAGTASDKKARSLAIGLAADGHDDWHGGGYSSGSLALTSGRLNLDRWAPDRTADAASAQAQGGYRKIAYAVSRQQRITDTTSVLFAISGQRASKNLDSSEQFSLGGPFGVRGYPTGEANGDEGLLTTVELKWDVAAAWQISGFLDDGRIRLHRNEWAGWQGANTTIRNSYNLASAGAGISWARPGDLSLRLMLARKLGDNPGRGAAGNDSDNRNDRYRLWLQFTKLL